MDRALALNFWKKNRIGNRCELFADFSQIFVGKNGENERRALVAENFSPSVDQNSCRGRIVCAINDRAFVPTLKASRPLDGGESSSDCGLVDVDLRSANGSDCDRGVELLMFATQRDGRFVVSFIHKTQRRIAFGGAGADYCFGLRKLWC